MTARWWVVMIFIVTIGANVAHTQDEPPFQPVYERLEENLGGIAPNSLYWSPDSRFLYFADYSYGRSWYRYEVATATVEPVPVMPFERTLSLQQQEHFRAESDHIFMMPGSDNFVFLSETEIFEVWIPRPGSYGGFYRNAWAIGNLRDGSYRFTNLTHLGAHTLEYRVRWSDDGTAFILENDGVYVGVEVRFVRSSPNCLYLFCNIETASVTSLPHLETIYDISPDGHYLLYASYYGLHLWNADDHNPEISEATEDSVTLSGNIAGAAFLPDDDTHLLVVTEEGIGRFNINTGEIDSINPAINSTWATWVTFSPNNRYVAVLGTDEGRIIYPYLYVLPVTTAQTHRFQEQSQ